MTHVQKYWKVKTVGDDNFTIDPTSLSTLRTWLKTEQTCLTDLVTDEQILLFLNACYGHLDEAKDCIRNYYRLRGSLPQIFQNRNVQTENLAKALEVLQYGIFPKKTPDDCKVVFHRLKDTKPKNYVFNDGFKLLIMMIDAVNAMEGPQTGFKLLFDMKGVKLGHVARLPLKTVKKCLEYLQDGIPVRLKSIHVLNVNSVIDKIMFLVKPFLRKKFLDLLHFHKENDTSVYESIPKTCMPSDYEGELESVDYYHEKFKDQMKLLMPLFDQEDALFGTETTGSPQEDAEDEIDLSNLEID